MKLLIGILVGLSLGIGGELLIPKRYWYGRTSGCLKLSTNQTFMPSGYMYDATVYKYPVMLFMESGFIPSYRFLYSILSKESEWLPIEKCNKLTKLVIESQKK